LVQLCEFLHPSLEICRFLLGFLNILQTVHFQISVGNAGYITVAAPMAYLNLAHNFTHLFHEVFAYFEVLSANSFF